MEKKQALWNMPEHILQASSVPFIYTVISASLFFLQLTSNKDATHLEIGF